MADASEHFKRQQQTLERGLRKLEHLNAHRGDSVARMQRIRSLLDSATGQRAEAAKGFLREIATMARAGAAPRGWRDVVETEYPNLVRLLEWVSRHDVDGKPLKPVQSGGNTRPTQEERKLVTGHLPLVRKLAVQRASKVNNLAGGTDLNDALLAHLELIGLEVLEQQVRRWNRAGGVTFGAFARPRVAGAMDNYLVREQIKNASSNADARERWKSEAHGARAKGNRTSTGGRRVKSYAESPKCHPTRLIKADTDVSSAELAAALAQLTSKERAVYESRVLARPQVPVVELAARLKVTSPRIVALEKAACWRMGKLLNRGN
jgi:DNA-directed RNA polymerase specialized sigma subunit